MHCPLVSRRRGAHFLLSPSSPGRRRSWERQQQIHSGPCHHQARGMPSGTQRKLVQFPSGAPGHTRRSNQNLAAAAPSSALRDVLSDKPAQMYCRSIDEGTFKITPTQRTLKLYTSFGQVFVHKMDSFSGLQLSGRFMVTGLLPSPPLGSLFRFVGLKVKNIER